MGYPMGGDNISITRGVVSRVDLMDYTMLGLGDSPLLTIQIDAAINPGPHSTDSHTSRWAMGACFGSTSRRQLRRPGLR